MARRLEARQFEPVRVSWVRQQLTAAPDIFPMPATTPTYRPAGARASQLSRGCWQSSRFLFLRNNLSMSRISAHIFSAVNAAFALIFNIYENIVISMKLIISSAILVLSGWATSSAQAGECDKYKTNYDKTYCMGKLFLESDKELNISYGELRKFSREPVNQQLKAVQLEWIRYRNESCESQGAINVECNYRVNRERAEYLRDRLRECKAGTCRDDMISSRSWP